MPLCPRCSKDVPTVEGATTVCRECGTVRTALVLVLCVRTCHAPTIAALCCVSKGPGRERHRERVDVDRGRERHLGGDWCVHQRTRSEELSKRRPTRRGT